MVHNPFAPSDYNQLYHAEEYQKEIRIETLHNEAVMQTKLAIDGVL